MPERMMPPEGGTRKTLAGETFSPNHTTPSNFWKGWGGPASMAEPIHRKPRKPADTLWRPKRPGGAS